MAKVVSQPGESVESLIRKFNKKVQNEGILAEIKKREHYLKNILEVSFKMRIDPNC